MEEPNEEDQNAFLNQIRKADLKLLDETLQLLGIKATKDVYCTEGVRLLIRISSTISQITYKKKSVKDKHNDIPWPSLEYLGKALEYYESIKSSPSSQSDHTFISLVNHALPLIIETDLPQLTSRLQHIQQSETSEKQEPKGTISAWGLENIAKLTYFYSDPLQLSTMSQLLILFTGSYTMHEQSVRDVSMLRTLAMLGETSKYISQGTKKQADLPWKNMEKVRDLLSHVSRIPMREALIDIFQQSESVVSYHRFLYQLGYFKIVPWLLLFVMLFAVCVSGYVDFMYIFAIVILGPLFFVYKHYKQSKSTYLMPDRAQDRYLPPNLLANLRHYEIPIMKNQVHFLMEWHTRLPYVYRPSITFVITLSGLLTALVFSFNEIENKFIFAFVLFLVTFILCWFLPNYVYIPSNFIGYKKKLRTIPELWRILPSLPGQPTSEMAKKAVPPPIVEEPAVEQEETVDLDEISKEIPSELRPIFIQAWKDAPNHKIAVNTTKQLFQHIKNKEHKQLWSIRLFGAPKIRNKKPKSSREERIQRYIDKHENSTLNREKGLYYVVHLRKYLQNPGEDRQEEIINGVIYAIDVIEKLEKCREELNANIDFSLKCYIEYYLGVFALYSAQIKWHFPKLLGNEHVQMREYLMHGVNHGYIAHMSAEGIEAIKQHAQHLFSVKPLLVQFLEGYKEK